MATLGIRDVSQNIGLTAVTVLSTVNNGRQYLCIQNLHATAIIWVRISVNGTAAVAGTAGCIRLEPGGGNVVYEDEFVPSGQVSIISDTASTPVTVWEA